MKLVNARTRSLTPVNRGEAIVPGTMVTYRSMFEMNTVWTGLAVACCGTQTIVLFNDVPTVIEEDVDKSYDNLHFGMRKWIEVLEQDLV